VDSASIGTVCSMFPTIRAWSSTRATGPPNSCVNGPSSISFNPYSLIHAIIMMMTISIVHDSIDNGIISSMI
jgi:hypothetical protein